MIYRQLLNVIQDKHKILVLFKFVFVNNSFCYLRLKHFNNVNLKVFNKILGSNIICNPN